MVSVNKFMALPVIGKQQVVLIGEFHVGMGNSHSGFIESNILHYRNKMDTEILVLFVILANACPRESMSSRKWGRGRESRVGKEDWMSANDCGHDERERLRRGSKIRQSVIHVKTGIQN